MTTPAEREYTTYRRGEIREIILQHQREGLRQLVDPSTGQPPTEDVLRRATARGTRFEREADAIDLVGQGIQKRGDWFVQQIQIDRASSWWLRHYHAPLWGESFLPAFGGSGTVAARGTPGASWHGSTLVPDSLAVSGRDSSGRRYQVLVTGTADSNGEATLTLLAVDGGEDTNIEVGEVITWINPPPGSDPTATVTGAKFAGGLDAETDADFARRLMARVRHKPAAGNWAHIRSLARQASVSVEDAFVYPTAQHAGSVLVAVVQKRGLREGPAGRIPVFSVLTAVVGMLVPPGSPVFPGQADIIIVPPVAKPSNVVMQLALPKGSSAGWSDREPFPAVNGTGAVAITTLTTQQDFRITASSAGQLPGGVSGPIGDVGLMVWDAINSRFESLAVLTVADLGGGQYRVLLSQAPSTSLAVGSWISPDLSTRSALAGAVTNYFDSLGPGEVVDLESDDRADRAYRNPVPSEEYPARAGDTILSYVRDSLGSSLSESRVASMSVTSPSIPTDVIDGPDLIVAGKVAVYHLPG